MIKTGKKVVLWSHEGYRRAVFYTVYVIGGGVYSTTGSCYVVFTSPYHCFLNPTCALNIPLNIISRRHLMENTSEKNILMLLVAYLAVTKLCKKAEK